MPPSSINLPTDFRAVADVLRDRPDDPASREFLALVRAEVRGSPRAPRAFLRFARRLHARLSGPDFVLVTLTGFRAKRLQHRDAALRAIATAWRMRGKVYVDRDLLVFGVDPPRRYGAPGSALRPMTYASPTGEAPAPAEPAPSSAPSPAPPPRPATPSFITK